MPPDGTAEVPPDDAASADAEADATADGDEGDQETYLMPQVPPGTIMPPNGDQFANATWLPVGPEITGLIEEVVNWDEFTDISDFYYSAVWRRRSTPTLNDGQPLWAGIGVVDQRTLWEAYPPHADACPRLSLDHSWRNCEALREEGQYVDGGLFQQHLHHALMRLEVENDILKTRAPDFTGFAQTVKRFGEWNSGIVAVSNQLKFWTQPNE